MKLKIISGKKGTAGLILSIIITALTACSTSTKLPEEQNESPAASLERVEAKKEVVENPSSIEAESAASSVNAEETAKRYYDYLKETVITEKMNNLVPTDPWTETMNLNKHEMYGFDAWKSGFTGLLSAFLEDFDNDGTLEMVGVFLRYNDIYNTIYRDVYFDPGSNYDAKTSQYTCMYLSCTVYDMDEEGKIESKGGYEWAIMPTDSWGRLLVGIEKMDNDYYLFGYSESENMSTYGPRHFVAGKLYSGTPYWSYSSILDYGRANASNYKELLHVGSLDINGTTLSALEFTPESLGNRLISMVNFDHLTEKKRDTIVITAVDCTDLRKHLESGGSTWKRIDLPQGGRLEFSENTQGENRLAEIVNQANQAAGTEFKPYKTAEKDGVIKYSYMSEHGTLLELSWNTVNHWLEQAEVVSAASQADNEWNLVKDVLVGLPELGMSPEQAAPFTGKIKDWLTYTNGIEINGYKISLFEVINAIFRAYRITS